MFEGLRFLAPYLRRYRGLYAVGTAMVLSGVAAGIVMPLLVKEAVERLEWGMGIGGAIGSLMALAGVRAVCQFLGRTRMLRTAHRVAVDIREECMATLARRPPEFYAKHPAGDLSSRVINDLDPIRMMAGFGLSILVSMGCMTVLALAAMAWMHPTLTAAAAGPMLGILAVFALTARAQRERADAVQTTLGEIGAAAQENFAGVRVVRADVLEEAEIGRMRALGDRFLDRTMALARVRGASWTMLALLVESAIGLTLWIGGGAILQGTLTRGELVAFVYYEFMLIWPMIALGWVVSLLQQSAACAGRLRLILDAPTAEPEAIAPDPAPARIEFRDLSFAYEGREPVLRGVTLSVGRGERVALVGRTGAGKSTLVKILAGLERADGAFLDGAPATPALVRTRVAFVPQDDFLFSEPLRDNIAFGAREEASAEAIVAAATTADLARDVEGFPDGYATMIGEKGITLSGGQRQRACLARALVKRAGTIVLDDAFSSVDVDTERRILENLDRELRGRTLLWVTHRLTSLRGVDRIAVLEGGRIVEEGDFESLAASGGPFARMLQRQQIERELEAE